MKVADVLREMRIIETDSSQDSGIRALNAWKVAVRTAYPEHAVAMKFRGIGDQVSAEVPGIDRSFGVFDLDTEAGEVLGETSNPEWHKRPLKDDAMPRVVVDKGW